MSFKLGKRPARYDRRDLLMSRYLDMAKLPPIPDQFGHEALISSWPMLGNDSVGDCVWAGAAHETQLWTAAGDPATAQFNDACVLSDYSVVTGYNTAEPSSDQGTDMHDAAKYRRQTGILDASGKRHKIGAYLWLEPGNVDHIMASVYLFGVVGLGIEFPDSAMDQFDNGQPWSPVGGSRVQGGHYVPIVAQRKDPVCVTWGQLQPLTKQFISKYCDEAVAMISADYLIAGKSPEGFDVAQLVTDADLVRK
jgi:hypothetical protein